MFAMLGVGIKPSAVRPSVDRRPSQTRGRSQSMKAMLRTAEKHIVASPEYQERVGVIKKTPEYQRYMKERQEESTVVAGLGRVIKRWRDEALKSSAGQVAERLGYEGRYKEQELVQLVGSFHDWVGVDTRRRNDQHYSDRSRAQRQLDIEKLVAFNHALREVINTHGTQTSLGDIVDGLMEIHPHQASFAAKRDQYESCRRSLIGTIIGIRNEMAFECVLERFGFDYKPGTNEDDRHGIDYYINGCPVDVKSSPAAVEAALRKRDDWEAATGRYNSDTVIFCPGFRREDFNGMLALPTKPYDAVIQCAPTVLNNMIEAGILTQTEVAAAVSQYKKNQQQSRAVRGCS